MSHRETNPHFSRSSLPEYIDYDAEERPHPSVPRQKRRGQSSTHVAARISDNVPPHHRHEDHPHPPIQPESRPGKSQQSSPRKKPADQRLRPIKPPKVNFQEQKPPLAGASPDQGDRPIKSSKVNFEEQKPPLAGASPVQPPRGHPSRRLQQSRYDQRRMPPEQKSNPLTWFIGCLCVIFWLIIIIGGLIVLIVYFIFRPQSPHFEVSSVTLNAAYLDLGYLLNADLTMLANFTNPNKKVHVDFSSVIIYLYYGSTLIATQYVEPFSAARLQSRFAYIHMVSSQVKLPLRESQRLVKQMESNGVLLEIRGVFRARSKLGSILRYSYNLYGRCNVMLTRPPNGIMLKKKCRTKR